MVVELGSLIVSDPVVSIIRVSLSGDKCAGDCS